MNYRLSSNLTKFNAISYTAFGCYGDSFCRTVTNNHVHKCAQYSQLLYEFIIPVFVKLVKAKRNYISSILSVLFGSAVKNSLSKDSPLVP